MEGGLGFHDFASMNVALLAKQDWRLLTQPTCLLTRVLKTQYFSHGCSLTARLSSSPSFTWRSLLGARGLLHAGIGWRIGTREAVNISNDSWVPNPGDGRISCSVVNIRYTTVSHLISSATVSWDEGVVHEVAFGL